jgi:hypothetical protein
MGIVAVTTPSALALDIPNPIDIVTHVVSAPAGWAWNKVAEGITSWVLGAVAFFVDGIVNFLLTAARPNVEAAWFSGTDSPYATVRNIAGVLLLGFVFLGLIQGLLAGDAAAMMRRVAADLPAAVLGMIGTTVVVGKLLELTDALSAAVLAHSGDQSVDFLSSFGVAAQGATGGFAAVLLGSVAVVAGLLLWIELMVRSVLVYIIVALSPLSFAAMVWPSARGVLRRTIELLLSVILSKLVICIAISVGVAALAGAGTADGKATGIGTGVAASMGTLFVGAAVLVIAAFAPFLVLKLIPWTEGALVAHGMSRSPVRAANTTVWTANSANSIARLAGGGGTGASALPAGGGGGGWTVGAPLQGSSGGASVGAVAGPAGVAAAGAVTVTAAGAKGAMKSVESSADAVGGGAKGAPAPTRGTSSREGPHQDTPEERGKTADAPPRDKSP